MSAKIIGLVVGLVLGLAVLHWGFFAALFLGLCALLGWFIGRVVEGEVSLAELLDRYSTRERV